MEGNFTKALLPPCRRSVVTQAERLKPVPKFSNSSYPFIMDVFNLPFEFISQAAVLSPPVIQRFGRWDIWRKLKTVPMNWEMIEEIVRYPSLYLDVL
ncbi:hypothetical protein HGRIS_003609 [Hohenbuehelia grisea]|uniref:Uncharacterized protein n=1 Tax=Hohenbuehelia grisea TaxID=104357 RepID=A0ABR3JGW4_9AGAR